MPSSSLVLLAPFLFRRPVHHCAHLVPDHPPQLRHEGVDVPHSPIVLIVNELKGREIKIILVKWFGVTARARPRQCVMVHLLLATSCQTSNPVGPCYAPRALLWLWSISLLLSCYWLDYYHGRRVFTLYCNQH